MSKKTSEWREELSEEQWEEMQKDVATLFKRLVNRRLNEFMPCMCDDPHKCVHDHMKAELMMIEESFLLNMFGDDVFEGEVHDEDRPEGGIWK